MSDKLVNHEEILNWMIEALIKNEVLFEDAKIIAHALTNTSLWGIDSHGIARVTHYFRRFENGTINKEPKLKFTKTAAASGQVDGDDGHGIVVMTKATSCSIELAKDAGVGVVGVLNSSHCGAIGLYTRQICEAGMVGLSFTQTDSLVVPHEGKKPFFGTNPISIAFPTENVDEPICLDMATSIVPWNYIVNARREKSKVPIGFGVDKHGEDSEIVDDIIAVKPIANHKGYALAFLIDMLCGPLNGMSYGPNISSMYKDLDKKRKLGSLVIAIDPERFGGRDTIRTVGTAIIKHVKFQNDHVLFPGEPEYINKKIRIKEGIPVSKAVSEDFNLWADKLGIHRPNYF